jgi:AraC family transcriptional regulator
MSTLLQNGRFYGRAREPVRVDDAVLTETVYSSGFIVPVHAHAQPFFCVLLEGAFTEHIDRAERIQQTRTGFYHPREWQHAESFHFGPARLFNIQLGGEWLERLSPFDVVLPERHIALGRDRTTALALQLYDEYRLGGERLIIDGLLLAMIGELGRVRRSRERGVPPWLDTVVEAIHASAPVDPGLAELARIAAVHPSHLARTFRAVQGCTPGEYARRLRVARARELMHGRERPLAAIALECGFTDQSHFTRVFRRETGLTPAAYRRAHASARS